MRSGEPTNRKLVTMPFPHVSNWKGLRAYVVVVAISVMAVFVGWAIAQESWGLPALMLGSVLLLLILLTQSISGMLLWWIAVGPLLARWAGVELGAGVPNITFDRLILGILVLLILKEVARARWRDQPQRQSITSVELGLGFWCLVHLGSVLFRSQSMTTGLFNVVQIAILPTMLYYIARSSFRIEETRKHLLRVLSFVAIYLAAGVLYEQITHAAIGSSGAGMISAGLMRSGSFLGTPWTLGYVLLLILPLMFYAEHITQERIQKGFYRLVIFLILLSVFFTYIRSVWITLVLQMFLLAVAFPKWRRLVAAGAIGLVITLIVIWPSLSRSDAVAMQLGNPTNLLGRMQIAEIQWYRFLEQPLFGLGESQGRIGLENTASHNTWLVMLVELGLIGTIPLLLAIGSAVWQRIRVLRMEGLSTASGRWGLVLLISLIPFGVISNAVDLTYFTFELALTFTYLALLVPSPEQRGSS
jgi:O-antigen ligase